MQIEKIVQLVSLLSENETKTSSGGCNSNIQVGKSYIIRSITHMWVGKVRSISSTEIILDSCSWIAESDRWMNTIKEGKLKEVEPMGDGVIVFTAGLIDATEWKHALPTEQK